MSARGLVGPDLVKPTMLTLVSVPALLGTRYRGSAEVVVVTVIRM